MLHQKLFHPIVAYLKTVAVGVLWNGDGQVDKYEIQPFDHLCLLQHQCCGYPLTLRLLTKWLDAPWNLLRSSVDHLVVWKWRKKKVLLPINQNHPSSFYCWFMVIAVIAMNSSRDFCAAHPMFSQKNIPIIVSCYYLQNTSLVVYYLV